MDVAVIGMLHSKTAGAATLRFQGYREALAAHGLEVDERLLGWADQAWHRDNGARAMAAVLDSGAPVDGVVAFNDALAIGALYELKVRGIGVPDEVAIVGFDDTEDARYTTPALTSVDPGRQEIAERAVELLCRRVRERSDRSAEPEKPVLHLAQMRIVERETTPRRA